MRMLYQGLQYEDYLKYSGQSEEQVKEMYRPEAKNRVKMQLVLEAMIKAEGIEPTEEDIENRVKIAEKELRLSPLYDYIVVNRDGMADECARDILAIVQEAISNAVRHGHAKNVRIASGPLEGGGFRLSVMNDGERFDPERALGPETGHFGLTGMRERATRSGFTFAFRERDGYFGLEMERKD